MRKGIMMTVLTLAAFAVMLPTTPAQAAYPDGVCGSASLVVKKNVNEYIHDGKTFAVAFCVMHQNEAFQDYFFALLKFKDPDLPNQQGVATRIEVEYLRLNDRLSESNDPDASCDQTNNWTDPIGPDDKSQDGRGCNRGNYSLGSGPCQGFRSIADSPMAFGSHGCQSVDGDGDQRSTTIAQTDKVNGRETDTDMCDATIEFRIRWSDGTNSTWKQMSLAAAC